MTYEVYVHQAADEDIVAAGRWLRERAPATVDRWLDRFRESVKSLRDNPQRCPVAPESCDVDFEVHEFHFGKRPNVFRLLFTIDGNRVRVIRALRAQRQPISAEELRRSLLEE